MQPRHYYRGECHRGAMRAVQILYMAVACLLPGGGSFAADEVSADAPVASATTPSHWAHQALKTSLPVTDDDQQWTRGPIDAFVLSGMHAQGLTPVAMPRASN